MDDNEKVILKSPYYAGGLDLSIIDYSATSSVKLLFTKVVQSIYKSGHIAYIGVKDGLLSGEIIQTGNLDIKYKIIGPLKKVLPRGGFIYRIKRVDGYNITLTDIEAVSVGDRVRIKNRKTFDQLMRY